MENKIDCYMEKNTDILYGGTEQLGKTSTCPLSGIRGRNSENS